LPGITKTAVLYYQNLCVGFLSSFGGFSISLLHSDSSPVLSSHLA
jgi:hypothetical protein